MRHGCHQPATSRSGRDVVTNRGHTEACEALLAKGGTLDPAVTATRDRDDVPSFRHIMVAYNNAKTGAPFTAYTRDLAVSRATGADISSARCGRLVARRIIECVSQELRLEDHMGTKVPQGHVKQDE